MLTELRIFLLQKLDVVLKIAILWGFNFCPIHEVFVHAFLFLADFVELFLSLHHLQVLKLHCRQELLRDPLHL